MRPEMNMGIVDPYTHALDLLATYAEQSYNNLYLTGPGQITDWTGLFCSRMRAHTNYHDAIKTIANKRVRGALDHFFSTDPIRNLTCSFLALRAHTSRGRHAFKLGSPS